MHKFEPMMHPLLRRLRIPALAAAGFVASSFGQTLVGNSPFRAPGGGGGASGPAEAYELAGSTSQGSQVSVCIYEHQKHRSEWISVGDSADGIRVVSYDAANDAAVVTIDGARRELAMRKATVASLGPSSYQRPPMPANEPVASLVPAPPQGPVTPASLARDQQEARMLVSDLLEIGVQQRKAYQEAKQKAAAAASSQPTN
ncbi:MAG TPA: hypothetical protein VN877_03225 [Opitutaceae bacterium]|nr:hypothetical protein [Opitutaceae bacterium]